MLFRDAKFVATEGAKRRFASEILTAGVPGVEVDFIPETGDDVRKRQQEVLRARKARAVSGAEFAKVIASTAERPELDAMMSDFRAQAAKARADREHEHENNPNLY